MSVITIIDTGISKKYLEKKIKDRVKCAYTYSTIDGNVQKSIGAEDEIGHGTMVCSAINMINKNVNYNIIKIFGNDFWADEDTLLAVLKDIDESDLKTDIIHISFGVQTCERLHEIENILSKLHRKGIIIVAAFANSQVLSYPAACNMVIGVAFDTNIISINEWIYVENSAINIYATGQSKNLMGKDGKMIKTAGSSFAAAFVSGQILKHLDSDSDLGVDDFLRNNAIHTYSAPPIIENKECFEMKKIVIFPFNKENHSIVRNKNMLKAELHKVLDTQYSPYIGKNAFELLSIADYDDAENDENDDIYIVENIMQFNWKDDFDTLVLGHIGYLDSILPFSLYDYIFEQCINNHKNIYSYDLLSEKYTKMIKNSGLQIYCPTVESFNVEKNNCGMLYEISKPVVGVFGTSSKQGKWSLQLKLREILENRGYRTGHLGTEPNALLFKNTKMSAVGFNSNIELSQAEAIALFNYQMHKIENSSDLLIFGTQSNIIPYSFGGLPTVPRYSYELICACEPQASILCINEWDDIEYIKKCIAYLESFYDNKVIVLAYFFKNVYEKWDANGMSLCELKYNYDTINYIKNKVGLPVYNMGDKTEVEMLCDAIVNYF